MRFTNYANTVIKFPKFETMSKNSSYTFSAGLALVLLVATALVAAAATPASTGGVSDTYGYRYTDSSATLPIAPGFPSKPAYDFVDISPDGIGGGLDLNITGLQSKSSEIGFKFRFYDNDYTACIVGGSGFVRFTAPGNVSNSDVAKVIPNTQAPNNLIAGFWTRMKTFDGPFDIPTNPPAGLGIYTKVIGDAPFRVFIVQFDTVEDPGFGSSSDPNYHAVTKFQIKLFETSNQIEYHYKQLQQGINTHDPIFNSKFTIGIENELGNGGLNYMFGDRFFSHADIPTTPFAIRFVRPLSVAVESNYAQPDGTIESAGTTKLSPAPGLIAKPLYGTVQRFEAPEFIYLNRNFVELDEIGDASDLFDSVPANDDDVAFYRLRNKGYAIDGQTVQGVERFFERTITEDIKVIWKWDLEFAVFVDSATGQGGFGNPFPGVGRFWYKLGEQFTASMDSSVEEEDNGLRVRTQGYRVYEKDWIPGDPEPPLVTRDGSSSRVVTDPFSVTNARRVKWEWTGQVRYTFDATGGVPGQPGSKFDDQAFVRYYNETGSAVEKTVFNSGLNTKVWIPEGRKVDVGSFYRTFDNCFTLADFTVSPGGDLGGLTSDISEFDDVTTINDNAVPPETGRVSRVIEVEEAEKPTQINWTYRPTVFRAIVPLGMSLDSNALVPALCDNGELSDSGPSEASLQPVGRTPTGEKRGLPWRWDQFEKKLYPERPGSSQFEWQDKDDPSKSYVIELVSGYPGDTVPLASELEDADGKREGIKPNYERSTVIAVTSATDYPGAPGAHYRHLYDPVVGRRPPTKLDLSNTDEWAFQEMTYTDFTTKANVDENTPGVLFATEGSGRSVLLYSYRPNDGKAATGNLAEEKLVVRVVESSIIDPKTPDDPELVLGRRGLELGGGNFGVVKRGGNTVSAVNPGTSFVVDFWLDAQGLKSSDLPVQIVTTDGGKLDVTLDADSSTITATYLGMPVTHAFSKAGPAWRHYVIHAFTSTFFDIEVTVLDFYVDGVRAEQGKITTQLSVTGPASSSVGTGVDATSMRLGVGAVPDSLLKIDKFRLFTLPQNNRSWLTSGELLNLRTGTNPQLRATPALLDYRFETAPTGGSFANAGSAADAGIGPVAADTSGWYAGIWARADVQEVATRLDGTLDSAGFGGSGYILNEVSNYNAGIYDRTAEVGTWGPVYPVNHGQLYLDLNRRLEVAYYENSYLINSEENPNVAWPYIAAAYDEIVYPVAGPHKDKAIYIASRIGSEGVDRLGSPQQVYSLASYSDLTIYNQPSVTLPGYNPNEEHALVAPSGRAALKLKTLGEGIANNPPLAAFALQRDINDIGTGYTSDPWVLVQVNNLVTGEPEMAAYQVFTVRVGTVLFPRPLDSSVNAIDGLAYESASLPENRFLTIDPGKAYDFTYAFAYPVFAGDLLIPPYPVNVVVGNVRMQDDAGLNGSAQRTFWRDVNGAAWVVSGEGRFMHQFHYPFRSDFYLPDTQPGEPVAWVPDLKNGSRLFTGWPDGNSDAGKVVYSSLWRSDYPKLKRGETVTYQGGEYFAENPGAKGLPAIVAMKAAELIYDDATPTMVLKEDNVGDYSARIIRPLDRHEAPFTVAQMQSAGFTPAASSKIFIIAERWYFRELPGSLQRRLYFDSLAEKLVFRGYLNDKDSGDSDLTAGPDPLNILEPNVLTAGERQDIVDIGEGSDWGTAVGLMYQKSQNPMRVRRVNGLQGEEISNVYLAGTKEAPRVTTELGLNNDLFDATSDLTEEVEKLSALAAREAELNRVSDALGGTSFDTSFLDGLYAQIWTSVAERLAAINSFSESISNYGIERSEITVEPTISHLDSFGVGAALVPNQKLLTETLNGSHFVTIAENNRSELDGAPVSLHIIEILPDRYRGAIKVIEGADAFSEKITLQHNGEFGANTGDLYYEWWIRDAGNLDALEVEIGDGNTLPDVDGQGNTLWQQYIPEDRAQLTDENAKHLGLHTIVFEGRPDVTLADKLVLMRYRHKSESGWNHVTLNGPVASSVWQPGGGPFQWAGAANSPQQKANGDKRYIPQLVMGWIKRILDRINPYEARYTDFFGNESPATYSSQIQIAGAPYQGKVALNPDKNVIENVGLIELYHTVLQRARELSIDNSSNPVATDGINQALLLAATRLSVLYELLAREAYSDAQDSTITVTDASDLASVASFTHAFQNFEPDLLHEELALLRGTDFKKSMPVDNRLFWNYAKGLGEAAYNVNYNIYDENTDGFINEDDARALYPQGHGDAWGHFLSAINMHYELLNSPNFSWKTRAELYSLMQNVLEVDFLDEKTFTKLAAGKARTGRDIIRATYRQQYTQEPDGQWQGYTDVDPDRAWGVSEWAHRAGQGAYFDWAVANALMPAEAEGENLDRIERSGAESEIGEIAGGLYEIQIAMDEANGGVNPLGFDADAITFDIDPFFDGLDWERQTHFEQIYKRAVAAGENAMETLDFAAKAGNKIHRIADDTSALIVEAFRQDLDYRNRLIEIFGTPYDGTIGFGNIYPEGYEGPDTQLFAYLNKTNVDQIIPQTNAEAPVTLVRFSSTITKAVGIASNSAMKDLYADVLGNAFENLGNAITSPFGNNLGIGSSELREAYVTLEGSRSYEDFSTPGGELDIPVRKQSPYAFQAESGWGQRSSYGRIQRILEEELRERIALDSAVNTYVAFLKDFEVMTNRLQSEINLLEQRNSIFLQSKLLKLTIVGLEKSIDSAEKVARRILDFKNAGSLAAIESLPRVNGFSNDVTSSVRGLTLGSVLFSEVGYKGASGLAQTLKKVAVEAINAQIGDLDRDKELSQDIANIEGILINLVSLSGNDVPMRDAIAVHLQNIELKRQEYFTAQAEGFRLLREREGFNKILAAKTQKNRYNDMIFRLARNEAMTKYQGAFNNAARYAWLAAKAYDFETSLDPGDPAAPGALLDRIVKERQLGLWADGPQVGQGGLAEILNQLNGNFQVLRGQLGLNNPQSEVEKISMRSELFRIGDVGNTASDNRWKDALNVRIEPDLTRLPQFVRHCRPFSTQAEGPQPGIVIRFRTEINNGVNFFGNPLLAGDHVYSTANFATKVRGFGVWLENYNSAGLSTTPRAYLVPVGNDYLRLSSATESGIRAWGVQEQRIPTPFVINEGNLKAPGFIPTLNGVDGGYSELRRHGNFRMYHDNGDPAADDSELILDSRLIGRSVWNSEWMLIIPGAGLHVNPQTGLEALADNISDIKLHFKTYSHQGQ